MAAASVCWALVGIFAVSLRVGGFAGTVALRTISDYDYFTAVGLADTSVDG
jgi:hypothetical protein